jgi:TonB family protein
MLVLFLASQLAGPTTTGPANWYKPDDYPIQYIEAGRSFDISLRLTVKSDGSLQGCAIEKSSGEKAFDKYNCALLLSRAKFSPAKDKDGRPTLGIYRTRVTWRTDDRKPQAGPGDLELTVATLPAGLSSPINIQVALAVDSVGRGTDCAGSKPDQNAALVQAACAQLLRSYRAIPARLPSGELVPSIQTATVSFLTQ